MLIKTPLWTHQQYVIDRTIQRGYTLLLGGCGIGKTLTAYALMQQTGAKRMLVLTIKNAIYTAWGDDARDHTEGVNVLCLHPSTGTVQKRISLAEHALKTSELPLVIVTNYEAGYKMPFDKWGLDIVVCDESHEIKSYNSKISKAIAAKSTRTDIRLALTGTAWDDRPTDVYGQARFVSPGTFGSWDDFFEKYVDYYRLDENPHVKVPRRYKNQGDLAAMLKPFTIIIPREVIRNQIAPEQHITRHITMSKTTREAYRQMEHDYMALIQGTVATADNLMVQELRLHQITGGFFTPYDKSLPVQRIVGADEKLEALMSILEEEIPGKPAVVFCRFREDISKIGDALMRVGAEPRYLTGDIQQHREWQDGDGRVLVVNIQAGGAGIKLTRATYTVYYTTGHSNTDYNQSIARTNRPGMNIELPSVFFHLLMKNTVDSSIYQRLTKKDVHSDTLKELIGTADYMSQ